MHLTETLAWGYNGGSNKYERKNRKKQLNNEDVQFWKNS